LRSPTNSTGKFLCWVELFLISAHCIVAEP
jgi:hypothetical protein